MNKTVKPNIFFQTFVVAVLIVFLELVMVSPALAGLAGGVDPGGEMDNVGNDFGGEINVSAKSTTGAVKKGAWQNLMDNLKKFTWDKALEELKNSGAIAYKQALKYFLNTLAYDMATYIATGDKGQLPMFQTGGWGGYLQDVADNAAGTFIESLGQNMSTVKFNLCSPDLRLMLRINLGLVQYYRPRKPACTFTEMTKNWETALQGKDFLPKFQDMFNPWSNDLGMALTLQTNIESEVSRKINAATQDRIEGQGFKSVTAPISGLIKTPSDLVRTASGIPLKNATDAQKLYTGSIVADSIDVFINTLAGKLIEQWLRGGLVTDFPQFPNKLDSLADYNAQNPSAGAAGAKDRMRALVEPNFKVRADYSVLAELVSCPDPNQAGPTDCVIDEKFRQAIEKRMTVGDALKQGYLNGNGIFGFTADGLEPKFNEGYPYRSMLILRKYRIIPVGWEVAAQKIKDLQGLHCNGNGKSCDNDADCLLNSQKCVVGVEGTKNLKDLVDCFSGASWCSGLVDPGWVLKSPQNFCKREGAGPQIISQQVTGQGADSSLSILRDDTYCADEQSVIAERSDGSNIYGYCTEERRKWDFNATACEPRANTCQTFSSTGGQSNSYLENTLDFSYCNLNNAGCQKYALAASGGGAPIYDSGANTVDWGKSNQAVYLNKLAETCEPSSEGCHGLIRVTPGQNETYNTIEIAGINKAYERFSPTGLIHEKLLPDYLRASCYDDKISYYELKANAPAVCAGFARQCKKEEAGCELYTGVTNETKIPAKVKPNDYCPAACVGYNAFIQSKTVFDSPRGDYFIPKTAKICNAEAAGCDQFTNLDEVAKGGEGVEYYTYLRQCLKKTGNESSCGEFYSWEGSDESGFQLKVESLKLADNKEHPATTDNNSNQCLYGLEPGQAGYEANKDCREFYSRNGQVSHYIFSKTIACSDDCHPYRRTGLNIDDNITSDTGQTGCSVSGGHWDSANKQCVVCESGGVWDQASNACLYQAIPGQGLTCAAAQNGCREYTGNTGNDIRNVFTDNFSDGTIGGWTGAVTPSNEAITLGTDNKGHSLKVTAAAERQVGSAVSKGLDYVLNFVAKADKTVAAPLSLTIVLSNGTKPQSFTPPPNLNTPPPNLTTAWQIFTFNLTGLNHDVTADEVLRLEANGIFYISSITLTEITDRYYLIKDSWKDNCDYLDADTAKTPVSEFYYAGCDQYTDRANQTHNLTKFSELCPESAVGCELMIDTKNSSGPGATYYQDGQKIETSSGADLIVPADSFTYAVYDPNKICGAEEKGCERLGKSYKYESAALYSDIYLKNNPDNYNTILCGAKAVGCDAFAYDNGAGDNGEKYFKDPGDQVCEYRQQTAGAGQSFGWYKKKVKRCLPTGRQAGQAGGGDNGAVCLTAADCPTAGPAVCATDSDCGADNSCLNKKCYKACLLETGDKNCPTSQGKTLGLGGAGSQVSQPDGGWAGVCEAADSGCTEYIDPVSKFSSNLIFNGSFQKLATDKTDGWLKTGNGLTQDITLEPNTVYRLARLKKDNSLPGALTVDCSPAKALYAIASANALTGPAVLAAILAEPYENSAIFYYQGDEATSCKVLVLSPAGTVELKPAILNYQLRKNLDRQSCNGIVDAGQGCVLFNERKQAGAALAALNWDADTGTISGAINNADKDSNVIFKVAPDRVCDKWLACKSYIKDAKGDNVCFDLGLCDAIDGNGNCQSFITSTKANQTVETLGTASISNLSGYSKVGLENGSLKTDYYPLGAMEQAGEIANLSNGGFEYYGSNLYPVGWTWGGQAAANKSWNANVFSVINNPIAAQTEGIGYAREGAAFLKLGSSYAAVSEPVDVIPNTYYVITAYLNTKNLKSGSSTIDILGKDGQVLKYTVNNEEKTGANVITQSLGNDWNFQMGRFNTGGNSQISIKLYSSAGGTAASEGNFYYDDIKIRPALNSKTDWYTTQSCRLYPQSDSRSCDYYEDSGSRQKGWYGYCLEYDRRPGDPNTCLLWYPIDKVKGDGIEEGAGYAGKIPVYYCTNQVTIAPPHLIGHVFFDEYGAIYVNGAQLLSVSSYNDRGYDINSDKLVWGDNVIAVYLGANQGLGSTLFRFSFTANIDPNWLSAPNKVLTTNLSSYPDWKTTTNPPINWIDAKFDDSTWVKPGGSDDHICANTCGETGNGYYRLKFHLDPVSYCQEFYQTVTPMEQNKYWSSRVYQGSKYETPINKIGYADYSSPFGSMVSAESASNPYEWDGVTDNKSNEVTLGIQPILSRDLDYTGPSLGRPQNVEETKRLFAQSYGEWTWSFDAGTQAAGRYVPIPGSVWGPPGTATNVPKEPCNGLCSNDGQLCDSSCNNCTGLGRRSAYPKDYCAILPIVSNIKINSVAAGNVNLVKNGFINLTFNTKADSNQLPLVMYGVDWGDGSKIIVTGVEMRDKPNADQPEIIYHLYSYWDLKAKAGREVKSITCLDDCSQISGAGQGACCYVQPKIQIKDNWGWCNRGMEEDTAKISINDCTTNQWQRFAGEVVVMEK